MKRYAIGNWKMNPGSFAEAKKLYSQMVKTPTKKKGGGAEVVVCPPVVHLLSLKKESRSKRFKFGAQNISTERSGSHTGEVSAGQVKDAGAHYVIVGHSERRAAGETNEEISKKIIAAGREGLSPILCVGEEERDDKGGHLKVLKKQIAASLAGVPNGIVDTLIVAYEPVWAIGAAEALDEDDIHEAVILLRKILSQLYTRRVADQTPILYGGSVTGDNIEPIMSKGRVDGVLVGRASLDAGNFMKVTEIVGQAK